MDVQTALAGSIEPIAEALLRETALRVIGIVVLLYVDLVSGGKRGAQGLLTHSVNHAIWGVPWAELSYHKFALIYQTLSVLLAHNAAAV